jgi:uncharacterized membrane protein
MRLFKQVMKWIFGTLMTLAGILHFINPGFYLKIMPPYLPWHLALVYVSGAFEILLGVLLLVPRYSHWAAWGLIALLIAVFPANLHMTMHPDAYPDLSPLLLWLRLPLQGILIAWAYWFTSGTPTSSD